MTPARDSLQSGFHPWLSLRSKRSCAFLAKGNPRIGERTSYGRAKNGESAKNEARGRGRGEKGTLASNHCESQIRPLGVARFSDFDELLKIPNQNLAEGIPAKVNKRSFHVKATREFEGFSQVEDTDLQIALKIHGAAICKM